MRPPPHPPPLRPPCVLADTPTAPIASLPRLLAPTTEEFVAHSSNVTCLQIGRKSGQVLVTGGEDKSVNMWRLGKHTNIMSLPGHTSAISSVAFDPHEEVVVAGSQGGSVKIFDLAEAKVARTLTGHMSGVTCVDFHPFGEFLASGAMDTNLKVWDVRKKVCIQTYKGHTREVNCVQFSPDGRWVISGGNDGSIKLWDLTAGKLLHEFSDHAGPITALDFNPKEFLLASGSADRTVKYWDLETFELVATTPPEARTIRALAFSSSGGELTAATQDALKVWSWEPEVVCHDSVDMGGSSGWNRVADIFNSGDEQLVGCSFRNSFVSAWVVDLTKVEPFGRKPPGLDRAGGGGAARTGHAQSPAPSPGPARTARTPNSASSTRTTPDRAESKEAGVSGEGGYASPAPGRLVVVGTPAPGSGGSKLVARQAARLEREQSKDEAEYSDADESKGYGAEQRVADAKDEGGRGVAADKEASEQHHVTVATSMGDSMPYDGPMAGHAAVAGLSNEEKAAFWQSPERDFVEPVVQSRVSASPLSPPAAAAAAAALPASASVAAAPASAPRSASKVLLGRVPSQRDAPVGLDFGQFVQRPAGEGGGHGVGGRGGSDAGGGGELSVEDAAELERSSEVFSTILRTRLAELRQVRQLWTRGSMVDALLRVAQLPDPTHVAADLLGAVSLKSQEGLNIEGCSILLPLVSQLLASKFDECVLAAACSRCLFCSLSTHPHPSPGVGCYSHVQVGVRSAATLFDLFSPVISDTRIAAKRGGIVDVNGEERQLRCERCFEQFRTLHRTLAEASVNKGGGDLGSDIQRLSMLVGDFIRVL